MQEALVDGMTFRMNLGFGLAMEAGRQQWAGLGMAGKGMNGVGVGTVGRWVEGMRLGKLTVLTLDLKANTITRYRVSSLQCARKDGGNRA